MWVGHRTVVWPASSLLRWRPTPVQRREEIRLDRLQCRAGLSRSAVPAPTVMMTRGDGRPGRHLPRRPRKARVITPNRLRTVDPTC